MLDITNQWAPFLLAPPDHEKGLIITKHTKLTAPALAVAGFRLCLACGAAEVPLETVTLKPSEALLLPGVSGTLLYLAQPEGLHGEPPAASARPLYGTLDHGRIVRLDESQGTGRGYDRLLADLNGDGTLTDERPFPALGATRTQSVSSIPRTFGPIQIARSPAPGAWCPAFYASLTLYHPQRLMKGQTPGGSVVGYMGVKPAAYLKARVEMDGVAETIGFVDGNGDLRVGDVAQFTDNARPKPREWEWLPTDYLFRDRDGSGKFERRRVRDELELLSNPIYFGGQPFHASFPPDGQLRLEPCANLATLQVSGDYTLESLVLLRRRVDASWEVVVPEVRANTVRVPSGIYRLFSCCYGLARGNERFFGQGFMSSRGKEVEIRPGQTVPLPCGPPLRVAINATQGQRAHPSLLASFQADMPAVNLRAQLRGAGDEMYTAFYRGSQATVPVTPKFPHYEITGQWFGKSSGTLRGDSDGSFAKVVYLSSQMAGQAANVAVTFDLDALGFASSTTATEALGIKSP